MRKNGVPSRLVMFFRDCDTPAIPREDYLNLRIDLGDQENPLFQALPCSVEVDLSTAPDIAAIADLIQREAAAPRCGGNAVLDRLSELLLVNLLRLRIEQQAAEPGVFAGLAHPKLSHVLVAMHDNPGKRWQVDDFLPLAGMSRSQFMSEFQRVIGATPMAYLKQWRMTLARAALIKGGRVKEVAQRFGYSSGDALCRAFVATYGIAPTKVAQ